MHRPFLLPGARPQYAPDRSFRARHTRLEIGFDLDRRRIHGTCALTLAAIADGARRLTLDAVEMEIAAVRLAGGTRQQAVPFTYDGSRLAVDAGGERKAGEEITLAIDYAATPRRGVYFIAPDEGYPDRRPHVWTQGQDEDSRHWFPCLDTPQDKATSELLARVPLGWYALSNGFLVETRHDKQAGLSTYHWRMDTPHSPYLVTLVAGEYVAVTDRWNDVEVSYFVPPGREAEARRSFGRTPRMIELFSQRTGAPYPYPKYAQIAVSEFIFGGMENTSATTLTDATLHDERAHLDFSSEPLVSHELAHQWFGDLLTCRDWSHGWLNEGFARFMELVWAEHADGADEAAYQRLEFSESYFREDRDRYRRPIVLNVYHEPIDVFDRHLYEKGACVLHMMRQLLGEGAFWGAVRHYVSKHREQSVETRDLVRAVEEATGRNLAWFADQWVYKAGHPELKVEHAWDAEAKLARLSVTQTQKVEGDTPLFRLPTAVRYRVGGRDVTFPLDLTEPQQTFYFPLPEAPTQAVFDPGQHLLKRAEEEKPRALWLAQLAASEAALDRVAAARAMARRAEPEVVAALRKTLLEDRFWGVQAEAAAALGEIHGAEARAALVEGLKVRPPKARRAVARALGELRGDETAAAALATLLARGDASYFVEGEAALSLGKIRAAGAFEALVAAKDRPSFQDVIRQRVFEGLGKLRDPRALPILLEGTRYGRPSFSRRAACGALAAIPASEAERRTVREALEALLEDPDFRVNMAAIAALVELGDARAVPAIERAIDRDLDGRVKRAGREAVRDLREGRHHDEALRELRDTLDRARDEIRALRDRMERLEAREGRPHAGTNGTVAPVAAARPRGARSGGRPAAEGAPRAAAKRRPPPPTSRQGRGRRRK